MIRIVKVEQRSLSPKHLHRQERNCYCMALHIDSGFNLAGATCVRAYDSDTEITRRYWFDETEDGRLVFVAEIHTGNNLRKYIDESEMCLLDQVAERACEYTDSSKIFGRDGKILYEQ